MKKPISDELAGALNEMAKAAGVSGPVHVLTPRICDKCQDAKKEAFPYGAVFLGTLGNLEDLCNDCFEELFPEFATCKECGWLLAHCICSETEHC